MLAFAVWPLDHHKCANHFNTDLISKAWLSCLSHLLNKLTTEDKAPAFMNWCQARLGPRMDVDISFNKKHWLSNRKVSGLYTIKVEGHHHYSGDGNTIGQDSADLLKHVNTHSSIPYCTWQQDHTRPWHSVLPRRTLSAGRLFVYHNLSDVLYHLLHK